MKKISSATIRFIHWLELKQVVQACCSHVLIPWKWFMPDMVKMALPLLVTELKCTTSAIKGEHQLIIQNKAVILGNCLPGGEILNSQTQSDVLHYFAL